MTRKQLIISILPIIISVIITSTALFVFVNRKSESHISLPEKREFKIVIIDSCEYVGYNYQYAALTHKGNCRNPYHNRK